MKKRKQTGSAYAGLSYQDLLDRETRPIPAALRACAPLFPGTAPLSVDCYLSRDYHELEKRALWPRVWQSLCRESEIANPGDFYVQDLAGTSVLVVRTHGGGIAAFPNACLHRGRQLKSGCGSGLGHSGDITCPFHRFRWNLSGGFEGAPCEWDFPHIDSAAFNLPGLRVDTWGDWVFVNIDGTAPPLREYLGVMVDHFERWTPEQTYKALHIKKVLRCNWKLAHEAFTESFHTVATHPQLLAYTGDSNSQYDCFNDHVSRTITPMGVVSPHARGITEEQAVHQWLTVYGVAAQEGLPAVPAGVSAREFLGEMNIRRFSIQYGQDLAPVTLEIDHKVGIITLNRPDVQNAINEAMLPPWVDALEACRTNPEVAVIAAVNGLASGAGVDVSLQCDIRFAARSASFRVSYTAFGLVPGNGGTYFLPRIVGEAKALELFWSAAPLTAEQALAIGMVNQVFEDEEFMARTMAFAHDIAGRAPLAMKLVKRAVRQSLAMDLNTHLDMVSSHMLLTRPSEDHAEAIAAYEEGRPPVFRGR